MTGKPARLHAAALDEAKAATQWYRNRSPAAAEAFLAELDRPITQISNYPERYQLRQFGIRRATLHKFPYVIVFRERAEEIEIIAVMHGRRRPSYWRDRV